jgi:hypothetical protein
MKKLILIELIVTVLVIGLMDKAFSDTRTLITDEKRNAINSFVPDPSKSQVNSSMIGKIKFAKNESGKVNIKNWLAIHIITTSDGLYYYNEDSTKTFPLQAGVAETIFVLQPGVKSVTVQFGNSTASVQGM